MTENLFVSFNSPQCGYMSICLRAGDEGGFTTAMRYKPYDSLTDWMKTLSSLIEGEGFFTVKWNAEPEEFDFNVRRKGERVFLNVIRYQDHRRLDDGKANVFACEGDLKDFCLAFWKTLENLRRDIETDEFDKNWRRGFPQQEFDRLRALVSERFENVTS
jgi:hypothetical protein